MSFIMKELGRLESRVKEVWEGNKELEFEERPDWMSPEP